MAESESSVVDVGSLLRLLKSSLSSMSETLADNLLEYNLPLMYAGIAGTVAVRHQSDKLLPEF